MFIYISHTHTHTHTHTEIYIYIYLYIYIYIYVYIYTYIHTYIHTYIDIYIYMYICTIYPLYSVLLPQILRVLDYLEVEVGVSSPDLCKMLRAFPGTYVGG